MARRLGAQTVEPNRLLVSGFAPDDCIQERLQEYFCAFGKINKILVNAKGNFAFVDFDDKVSVAAALSCYSNNTVNGSWVETKAVVKGSMLQGNVDKNDRFRISVSGIPEFVDENDLNEHFGQYGPIKDVQMRPDGSTGKKKAYVIFDDEGAAVQLAVHAHADHCIKETLLDVWFTADRDAVAVTESKGKGKSMVASIFEGDAPPLARPQPVGPQVRQKPISQGSASQTDFMPNLSSKQFVEKEKLFVGGIPFGCNEEDLRAHFVKYGSIDTIIQNHENNSAFVAFDYADAVEAALRAYNAHFVGDRWLEVKTVINSDDTFEGPPDQTAIFVGRLPRFLNVGKIKGHFSQYGPVQDVRMGKGFCHVIFDDNGAGVHLSMHAYADHIIEGQWVDVRFIPIGTQMQVEAGAKRQLDDSDWSSSSAKRGKTSWEPPTLEWEPPRRTNTEWEPPMAAIPLTGPNAHPNGRSTKGSGKDRGKGNIMNMKGAAKDEGGSTSVSVQKNIIFVGGLASNCDEVSLESHFQLYGAIVSLRLNRSKNCGFVHFHTEASAKSVLREWKNHAINGRWVETKALVKGFPQMYGAVDRLRLFVDGLPRGTDDRMILTHFSQFGAVRSVQRKNAAQYCFLVFADGGGVQLAIHAYNDHFINGKWIEVGPAEANSGEYAEADTTDYDEIALQEIAKEAEMRIGQYGSPMAPSPLGQPQGLLPLPPPAEAQPQPIYVEKKRVLITSLASECDERQVVTYFQKYGNITQCNYNVPERSCLIDFQEEASVRLVLGDYANHSLNGRWVEAKAVVNGMIQPPNKGTEQVRIFYQPGPTDQLRIFVNGLPDGVTQPTIMAHFRKFGQVKGVMKPKTSASAANCCCVAYETGGGVQLALYAYHEHSIEGKRVEVSLVPPTAPPPQPAAPMTMAENALEIIQKAARAASQEDSFQTRLSALIDNAANAVKDQTQRPVVADWGFQVGAPVAAPMNHASDGSGGLAMPMQRVAMSHESDGSGGFAMPMQRVAPVASNHVSDGSGRSHASDGSGNVAALAVQRQAHAVLVEAERLFVNGLQQDLDEEQLSSKLGNYFRQYGKIVKILVDGRGSCAYVDFADHRCVQRALCDWDKHRIAGGWVETKAVVRGQPEIVGPPDRTRIAVDRLPRQIDENAIVQHFSQYGAIKHIDLLRGQGIDGTGICFVNFESGGSVQLALHAYESHIIHGHWVEVRQTPMGGKKNQRAGPAEDAD